MELNDEYRIKIRTGFQSPHGWAWKTIQGVLLCGGLFGWNGSHLTHIPTGRSLGGTDAVFNEKEAIACAEALIKLDLPWKATTAKEWNKCKGSDDRKRAREIVKSYTKK